VQAPSAEAEKLTAELLLTEAQRRAFRYFYDYGFPGSGLARERLGSRRCAIGGTGFGLLTLIVGCERGFASREAVSKRVLRIVRFLEDKAERFHGAFSHHLNGKTGKAIPFAGYKDDGGDLVETSYLVAALLTLRKYFNREDPTEQEIKERATRIWHEVQWDWYLRKKSSYKLYWHWSPRYDWAMNLPVTGFNECMITYLLAIASPTHPIPPECYYKGWASSPNYVNGKIYYGYRLKVGPPYGGPLFFTQFSFVAFDPRGKRDRYCNYFENNRIITLINRAHCIKNPHGYPGYGPKCWGLSASDDPRGYKVHDPLHDNGTITPSVVLSALPYLPKAVKETALHFYNKWGDRLWGPYGFYDAFNLRRNWFARSYIAIDVGTVAPMIENYRTGLCWNLFMQNEEIGKALEKIGWKKE